MLYRENDQFKLMPFVATYTQHDEEHEQHVTEKADLEAFTELGHIQSLTFKEADYSAGQKERLEEVKEFPESELQAVAEYVLNDKVLPGTTLEAKKQKESLEQSILEIAMMQGGMFG